MRTKMPSYGETQACLTWHNPEKRTLHEHQQLASVPGWGGHSELSETKEKLS